MTAHTGVSFDRYRRAALALTRALGIEVPDSYFDASWGTFDGGHQYRVEILIASFSAAGPDRRTVFAALVDQSVLAVRGALVFNLTRARDLHRGLDTAEAFTCYLPHAPPLATCAHCLREYDARELAARPLAHPPIEPGVRVCVCARPLEPPATVATPEVTGV